MANVYDAIALKFDDHRRLPDGVPEAIRDFILRCGLPDHPRLLDLGAGSGRIGWPFVQAGDDYIGVDLSTGMLSTFAVRHQGARLVQADGARLPFAGGTFDAVLLIQVLSGAQTWRALLAEARRVLRQTGALIIGRVVAPDTGVDAQMKAASAKILDAMGIHLYRDKPRDKALAWLQAAMPNPAVFTVARWTSERTPRAFLQRHGNGARFSVLHEPVKCAVLGTLGEWAAETFGSIDTAHPESYHFELTVHRLQQGTVMQCPTP